jgi:hypothetical protein
LCVFLRSKLWYYCWVSNWLIYCNHEAQHHTILLIICIIAVCLLKTQEMYGSEKKYVISIVVTIFWCASLRHGSGYRLFCALMFEFTAWWFTVLFGLFGKGVLEVFCKYKNLTVCVGRLAGLRAVMWNFNVFHCFLSKYCEFFSFAFLGGFGYADCIFLSFVVKST